MDRVSFVLGVYRYGSWYAGNDVNYWVFHGALALNVVVFTGLTLLRALRGFTKWRFYDIWDEDITVPWALVGVIFFIIGGSVFLEGML